MGRRHGAVLFVCVRGWRSLPCRTNISAMRAAMRATSCVGRGRRRVPRGALLFNGLARMAACGAVLADCWMRELHQKLLPASPHRRLTLPQCNVSLLQRGRAPCVPPRLPSLGVSSLDLGRSPRERPFFLASGTCAVRLASGRFSGRPGPTCRPVGSEAWGSGSGAAVDGLPPSACSRIRGACRARRPSSAIVCGMRALTIVQCTTSLCIAVWPLARRALLGRFLPRLRPLASRAAFFSSVPSLHRSLRMSMAPA
jgi:hypothetical protein